MAQRTETHHTLLSLKPLTPWVHEWHVVDVLFPRRTITGRLVRGKVLRRYDGRKWIYKKMTRATD